MTWLKSLTGLVMPFWLAPLIVAIGLAVLTGGAYYKGKQHERTSWVNKQNTELVQSQQQILELTAANRKLEHTRVIEADYFKTFYQRKLSDEKTHTNAVIADVRSGVKRLRIGTKAVPACNSGVSLTAASGNQPATEAPAELSESAAEFLIRFASDADQTVIESNYVKDLLLQCRAHVDALRAQSMSTNTLRAQSTNQKPSNLTTILQLNSQPKEISND